MREQCVPGASPFFARAGDEASGGGGGGAGGGDCGGGGSKGNDISDLIVDLYLLPKSVPLVASNFSICTEPRYIHIH